MKIEKLKEEIVEGVNETVDVIASTMGAKGKYVNYYKGGKNKFTKDGVTVANWISFKEPIKNIGCELIKTAANKTVENVGDGTTCTSVILRAMINESQNLSPEDTNKFIEGVDVAVSEIINDITNRSKSLKTIDELKNICTIASNSEKLGDLLAQCYSEVGFNSLVALEKSMYSDNTYYDVSKGIEFSEGMVNLGFANSPGNKCIFEKAYICVEQEPIRTFSKEYQDLFENCLNHNVPLVIIAPTFSDNFIRMSLLNKKQSQLNICLIKTPGFGNNKLENIQDILTYTSDDMQLCNKIVISPDKFIMYHDNENKILKRVEKLEEDLKQSEDQWEVVKITNRIHKLRGTTAVIYTGGISEESQSEEYDRLEDALGSVKSAIKYGYVAGGGITLYDISKTMSNKTYKDNLGYKVVKEAIKDPLFNIVYNANDQIDISKLDGNNGYNVKTKVYGDMITMGIIDPSEVLKEAVKNAADACKLFINTKYNLIDER